MKVEIIHEFLGVEVGTVHELPNDVAQDLINKKLAVAYTTKEEKKAPKRQTKEQK